VKHLIDVVNSRVKVFKNYSVFVQVEMNNRNRKFIGHTMTHEVMATFTEYYN